MKTTPDAAVCLASLVMCQVNHGDIIKTKLFSVSLAFSLLALADLSQAPGGEGKQTRRRTSTDKMRSKERGTVQLHRTGASGVRDESFISKHTVIVSKDADCSLQNQYIDIETVQNTQTHSTNLRLFSLFIRAIKSFHQKNTLGSS